jgi:predicted permease
MAGPTSIAQRLVLAAFAPYIVRMAVQTTSGDPRPDLTDHALSSRLRRGGVLEDVLFDLRFAVRALRRSPAFTLVAVVTFAVGMGATTAMLSVANAVLLRPAPIHESERMAAIWELRSGNVRESIEGRLLPYDRYEAYREATTDVFEDLAGHGYWDISLVTDDGATSVDGFLTSGNYFSVLGLTPLVGRLFEDDDDEAIVLSERLWRGRFGADPTVVGRTISVDSRTFTIAGVVGGGFLGTMTGFTGDVWISRQAYVRLTELSEDAAHVVPIGRLRAGVDRELAEERVSAATLAIPPESSGTTVRGARLDGLQWRTDVRQVLITGMTTMVGAAALLLLIACANIAAMILARTYDRRREVAVRLAIGAGSGRLVRQMLTESILLALVGGAGGIVVAWLGTAVLSNVDFPIDATLTFDATPDPVVLLASFSIAAFTGMLFGLGPALRSARIDLTTSLKEGAQGRRMTRRKNAFVVGQLALSTVLLVTAGLFARSAVRVATVSLGFDPEGVVVAGFSLEPHGYGSDDGAAFYERLLERVGAIPGVESASLAHLVLLGGANRSHTGRAVDDGEDPPGVNIGYNVVDPEYFSTNGMELVEGRLLNDADNADAPRVAVVNQTLAERMWPGQSAVGRRYTVGSSEREVVGVLRDGVYIFMFEDPQAFAYYPRAQSPGLSQSLHVRASGPLGQVATELRQIVADLDPNIAMTGLRTMEEVMSSNRYIVGFVALFTTLFALAGLLLASIGVYGLLAVQVAQRGREFGVRMALGAKARDVVLLVVGRGFWAAAAGCVFGVVLALATGRVLDTLLYEVSPFDLTTFVAVPTVLLTTAVVASVVPARRAARVSPIVTLREE